MTRMDSHLTKGAAEVASRSKTNADGTVGKALDVLELVAGFRRPVRFNEILEHASYPKTTLYRLLQTLVSQDMLVVDPHYQTYQPGIRLVRLAHAAWRQSSIAPIAREAIDRLSSEVGETIHLAQLQQGQVLYVDKRNARHPVDMFSEAGKIGPGYCTGVGKAMMAYLDVETQERTIAQQSFFRHTAHTLADAEALRRELAQIRQDGVAFDREEHEPGIICIAAPILTDPGRVIGALSITTTTHKRSLADLEHFRPALLSTAKDIARAAQNWQFPT